MAAALEPSRQNCEEDPLRGNTDKDYGAVNVGDKAETATPPKFNVLLMTSFMFSMSVIWATMGMVVLPAEALHLFPGDESLYLGFFLFVTGLSQLVCPVAGLLSDRLRSPWGKRRPFICFGTILAVSSIVGMWLSSVYSWPGAFFNSLFLSQTGLNIIYAVQASIVPDLFRVKMGEVSGMVSSLQMSGQLFGMFYIIFFADYDYHYTYGVYIVLLSITACLVCVAAQERPSDNDPPTQLTLEDVKKSFWIDLEGDRDFFWVFVGRTFFYMATAIQTFIYFYLRDLMEVHQEASIRWRLAMLALVATALGLGSAYPLGQISDRVGRKPLIYYACSCMAFAYAGYTLCPHLGPTFGMQMVYVLGGLYGLGLGGYLSVDYALAIDCLPEKQKGSSEALGLWGIAGFIGSALGPMVGGCALESLGGWGAGGHYTYNGYVVLLSIGIVCNFFAGYFTSLIKKAK